VGAAGETPTMGGCRRVPDRRQLDLPPRSLVLFSERHRRVPRGSEAAAPGGALRAMDSSARPRLGRTESSSQVSTRRLASSALPRNSNGSSGEPGSMVICDSVLPNTRAPTTNNSGSTHNAPLNCSDRSPTAAGASEPPDLRGTAHRGRLAHRFSALEAPSASSHPQDQQRVPPVQAKPSQPGSRSGVHRRGGPRAC
jgi:hypothetical protein